MLRLVSIPCLAGWSGCSSPSVPSRLCRQADEASMHGTQLLIDQGLARTVAAHRGCEP
jgi:hypothetical protein